MHLPERTHPPEHAQTYLRDTCYPALVLFCMRTSCQKTKVAMLSFPSASFYFAKVDTPYADRQLLQWVLPLPHSNARPHLIHTQNHWTPSLAPLPDMYLASALDQEGSVESWEVNPKRQTSMRDFFFFFAQLLLFVAHYPDTSL